MQPTKQKKWENSVDLDKEIDHVVFNDPATIVFWKDGTKTVTKCHAGDTFNKETGLAMCIIRKLTKTNIIIMYLKNIATKKNEINIDK